MDKMSQSYPRNQVSSPCLIREHIGLNVIQQQFQGVWVKRKHSIPETGHIDPEVVKSADFSITDCNCVHKVNFVTLREVLIQICLTGPEELRRNINEYDHLKSQLTHQTKLIA